MASIQNPGPTTSDGPITFADVVLAVGDSDPARVNARDLRERIGRGSLSTIQKHLAAIREETGRASISRFADKIPDPPNDLIGAVWSAAFVAAQASSLVRLEALAAERDLLGSLHESLARDVNTLAEELDSTGSEQKEELARIASEAQAEIDKLTVKLQEVSVQARHHEERRATAEQDLQECRSRQALTDREHQLRCLTLQGEVDRLVEQMARMRSLEIFMAAQVKEGMAEQSPAEPSP
jgi:Skp family chaperone for outer membrane proteins